MLRRSYEQEVGESHKQILSRETLRSVGNMTVGSLLEIVGQDSVT